MILPEGPKSFIASVRVNLMDIAVVAKYLADIRWEIYSKSRGRLASIAIKILGKHLIASDPKYAVKNTEEAIQVLRGLGYGESIVEGRRDRIPLLRQLTKEDIQIGKQEDHQTLEDKTAELRRRQHEREEQEKHQQPKPALPPDEGVLKKMLAPEPEAEESEPEPSPKPRPSKDPPQTKEHTSEQEKKEIKKSPNSYGEF